MGLDLYVLTVRDYYYPSSSPPNRLLPQTYPLDPTQLQATYELPPHQPYPSPHVEATVSPELVWQSGPLPVFSCTAYNANGTIATGVHYVRNITPSGTSHVFTYQCGVAGYGYDQAKVTFCDNTGNTNPTVEAGNDQVILNPTRSEDGHYTVPLVASVIDDNKPCPLSLDVSWSYPSQPWAVDFRRTSYDWGDGTVYSWATFNEPGTYRFRLNVHEYPGSSPTFYDEMTVVINSPPAVDAGQGGMAYLDLPAPLSGTVTDDGYPQGVTVSSTWSVVSAPEGGIVNFENANQPQTRATFNISGPYVLRLTASDSVLSSSGTVGVGVYSNPGDNHAPQVGATADKTVITLPHNRVNLIGAVTDDRLPFPPGIVTTTWSQVAGPLGQVVSFASASMKNTIALFPAPGLYTLRLTASDGELSGQADVIIGVNSPPNFAPLVRVTADQTEIILPLNHHVNLTGTFTDDGLPDPPRTTTTTWSQVAGPPTQVTFADASMKNTTASFAAPGVYTLRLTASDSELSGHADVTIDVIALNQAPQVDAGGDQDITLPDNFVVLHGSATDDGFPRLPGTFTTTWAEVSGPCAVNFDNASQLITTAHFSQPGAYVLKLSADDTMMDSLDTVTITVHSNPADNQAPNVEAGDEQRIIWPTNVANWEATVTDEGFPAPPGVVTIFGEKVSGPGSVNFYPLPSLSTVGTSQVICTAQFSQPGLYELRLTVSDSVLSSSDTVSINVEEDDAPQVSATADQTVITLSHNRVNLTGTVTDDGLPNPPGITTTTWSQVAGPIGQVSFDDDSRMNTTAAFAAPGGYILRLTASDGALSSHADVTITAYPAANQAPQVDAGADQTIAIGCISVPHFYLCSGFATLHGRATDDGLPNPPGTVSTSWAKVSGPGDVDFDNDSQLSTTASFIVPGDYVLRLSANDTQLTSSDTVTIHALTAGLIINAAPTAISLPDHQVYLEGVIQNFYDQNTGQWAIQYYPENCQWTWMQVGGPAGRVSFTDATMQVTTASFASPGVYTLRSSVIFAEWWNQHLNPLIADVTITVDEGSEDPTWNCESIVNAHADQTMITLPVNQVNLSASVNGNGWDTYTWRKTQGPGGGEVSFSDDSLLDTAATFDVLGVYTLRFSVINSDYHSCHEDVSVTVRSNLADNQAPHVEAGNDQSFTLPPLATGFPWPISILLYGTVTDDDLPLPTALTTLWEKVSGPGDVTFRHDPLGDSVQLPQAGAYVLKLSANDSDKISSDTVTITARSNPADNQAPQVEAGLDQSITLPFNTVNLDATVTDDGFPAPPGAPTTHWEKVSGPSTVTFSDAAQVDTSALFSQPGVYVLGLSADDTEKISSDTVTITVHSNPLDNRAPQIDAGNDRTINWPIRDANWTATVTDDGLPIPGGVTVSGEKISGPGAVSFHFSTSPLSLAGTANVPCAAHFSQPGLYELRLTVSDSVLSSRDTVFITVEGNIAPQVSASADQTEITLPFNHVNLTGTVTDDGLPNPPGITTTTWSQVAGPIGQVVSFASTSMINTTATFPAAGVYTLRLTASDSVLSSSDVVTVTVNPAVNPAVNQAPQVEAGGDQTITLPDNFVILHGSATDDNLPRPPGTFTTTWAKASGPGTVSFDSVSQSSTTAHFSQAGVYVLRLSADDTQLTSSDTVQIAVNSNPASIFCQLIDPDVSVDSNKSAGQTLARDDRGHLFAVYVKTVGGKQQIVYSVSHDEGLTWLPPQRISAAAGMEGYDQYEPAIAIAGGREPRIVWRGKATGFSEDQIWNARLYQPLSNEEWSVSPPYRISTAQGMEGRPQGSPSIAVDKGNRTHVAWQAPKPGSGSAWQIWYTRLAEGNWPAIPLQVIGETADMGSPPRIAIDPRSDAYVVWSGDVPGDSSPHTQIVSVYIESNGYRAPIIHQEELCSTEPGMENYDQKNPSIGFGPYHDSTHQPQAVAWEGQSSDQNQGIWVRTFNYTSLIWVVERISESPSLDQTIKDREPKIAFDNYDPYFPHVFWRRGIEGYDPTKPDEIYHTFYWRGSAAVLAPGWHLQEIGTRFWNERHIKVRESQFFNNGGYMDWAFTYSEPGDHNELWYQNYPGGGLPPPYDVHGNAHDSWPSGWPSGKIIPYVDALPDQVVTDIQLDNKASLYLHYRVAYDADLRPIRMRWGVENGPGHVEFQWEEANYLEDIGNYATFRISGIYTLFFEISCFDFTHGVPVNVRDRVIVTVNRIPYVNAGTDQLVEFLSTATSASTNLDATVNDDGFPDPPHQVDVTWTVDSAPAGAAVNFGDSLAVDTTASFSHSGTYIFRLTADDHASQKSDTMTLVVTHRPVAHDQTVTLDEDNAVDITLEATNEPDETLRFMVETPPQHGALTLKSANVLTYTPTLNYDGTDEFAFLANDGFFDSNVATVSINVTSIDDAPVAEGQNLQVDENTSLLITLVASDVENEPLKYIITSQQIHGTLHQDPPESPNVTYTPDTDYFTPVGQPDDSFTFKVVEDHGGGQNGLESAEVAVTIKVLRVNKKPVADDVSVNTPEDTTVSFTLSANDPDQWPNMNLEYQLLSNPGHGQLTGTALNLTYTPNKDYYSNPFDPDTFTYWVWDGAEHSNVATVSINVTPVDDAPVAEVQHLETNQNEPKTITLLATDAENEPLKYIITSQQIHGTLHQDPPESPNVTYTPDTGYFTPDGQPDDSFTFKVVEDHGGGQNGLESAEAAVTIKVLRVNKKPTAVNISSTTNEDTAVSFTLSASDLDKWPVDPLTYDVLAGPPHGQLTGSPPNLTYVPALNYNNDVAHPDTFTYWAWDGRDHSNVATVSITVDPVDDPPVADSRNLNTKEDTPLQITLTASDVENEPLKYIVLTQPSHGTLSGTGRNVTYTPTSDFYSPPVDSFTFKVQEDVPGGLESNVATISITVDSDPNKNHPPVPISQPNVTTPKNQIKISTLSATDPDLGDTVTEFRIVDVSTNGNVQISGMYFRYTPDYNFRGLDHFTFIAKDNHGLWSPDNWKGTVTIAVGVSDNHPPEASQVNVTVPMNQQYYIQLATDVDHDPLTFQISHGPTHGQLRDYSQGVYYTPTTGFQGLDTFVFVACDQLACTGEHTATITVGSGGTAGTIQFSPVTYTVGEAGGQIVLNVKRLNGTSGAVGVTYRTSGGTATGGSDFQMKSGILRWADKDGADKTFTVTINDDPTPEGNEDFYVDLVYPEGGAVLGDSRATVTIIDNDSGGGLGTIQFNPTSYTINEGSGTVTLTVERVNGSQEAVSVEYITYNGSAEVGSDYQSSTGTLRWGAGDTTSKQFTVRIIDDSTPLEDPETFHGYLFNQTLGAGLQNPVATVTIVDNDVSPSQPGTIQFEQTSYTVNEDGGGITLNVKRVNGSEGDVTVHYNTSDGTAGPGDYQETNGNLTWSSGESSDQSFWVPIFDDIDPDGDKAFSANLSILTGEAGLQNSQATVTIVDNDGPPTAGDDTARACGDRPVDIPVLDNDSGPSGDPLTITDVSSPDNGTAGIVGPSGAQMISYKANAGFSGSDSFSYTIMDGNGSYASASVTVDVKSSADNSPPIAKDDLTLTPQDTSITIDVVDNDSDQDGDPFHLISWTSAAHGTVTPFYDGRIYDGHRILYQPPSGFVGEDSFSYTITDLCGAEATASVIVYVVSPTVNYPPAVEAGANQTITLPVNTVTLDATVTDDGLPTPPGVVTTLWEKVSGPGSVAFGNASLVDTSAQFSAAGVYVLRLTASDSDKSASDTVQITVNSNPAANLSPAVEAGANQIITLPVNTVSLDATVTDDGLPTPPGVVITLWEKVSGPGSVTFGNASQVDTSAQFSAAGVYVLRITASDSDKTASDTVQITVNSNPASNQAPVIDAGANQTIILPMNIVTLNGTVTDDGLPTPPGVVTTLWEKVSGPGSVAFGNASLADTSAQFSAAGVYVLRLTASDSDKSASDTVQITVNSNPAANLSPAVEAGANQTITLPVNTVTLDATVTDDGLPMPPGVVTTLWEKLSGPGSVAFGNASLADTSAEFSAPGVYVLRLTANDSDKTASDTVQITVNSNPADNQA
ncbi:MAG: Ig-like domain-containing protein, partial [Elusimicrobia bacterium]|nr:Ig-like domain-containing protein [Candidatus Obscuribacterium magneticum]